MMWMWCMMRICSRSITSVTVTVATTTTTAITAARGGSIGWSIGDIAGVGIIVGILTITTIQWSHLDRSCTSIHIHIDIGTCTSTCSCPCPSGCSSIDIGTIGSRTGKIAVTDIDICIDIRILGGGGGGFELEDSPRQGIRFGRGFVGGRNIDIDVVEMPIMSKDQSCGENADQPEAPQMPMNCNTRREVMFQMMINSTQLTNQSRIIVASRTATLGIMIKAV